MYTLKAERINRNWLRFLKDNALVYVNSCAEHDEDPKRGNHGWYDLDANIYDELVNEETYNTCCVMLLGSHEKVFVLSKDDIIRIFDKQHMDKPDEGMFYILEDVS